jgi:hypothetical protein
MLQLLLLLLLLFFRENFTKGYRTIPHFYRRILNYHSSRTRSFNYQNESQKGILSILGVKMRRKSIHVTFLMSLVFFAPDFNGYNFELKIPPSYHIFLFSPKLLCKSPETLELPIRTRALRTLTVLLHCGLFRQYTQESSIKG